MELQHTQYEIILKIDGFHTETSQYGIAAYSVRNHTDFKLRPPSMELQHIQYEILLKID